MICFDPATAGKIAVRLEDWALLTNQAALQDQALRIANSNMEAMAHDVVAAYRGAREREVRAGFIGAGVGAASAVLLIVLLGVVR